MSFTWNSIRMLITSGFSETAIRRGAEMIAMMRGWKPVEFANFVMFLYRLPADVLAQVESFIGNTITFSAPGTPPGATNIAGSHDPDLPDCCNEFRAQLYMLKGAVMEEIAEDAFVETVPKKVEKIVKEKPAK